MTIRYVVLDYDGTCTDVPAVAETFLAEYRRLFKGEIVVSDREWEDARAAVHAASPEAAWSIAQGGSAPAAADPYTLAYEVERRILDARAVTLPPERDTFYRRAYAAPGCDPPWRPEAREVLEGLVASGVAVWFVSNAAEAHIDARLDALFGDDAATRAALKVRGGAGKYVVGDLRAGASLSSAQRAWFESLPRAVTAPPLKRDVLLHRPSYFDVLAGIWGDDATAPGDTLVCGDVWELDLAMPAALGCQAHLVTRSAPYATCEHERRAAEAMGARGGVSAGLRAVLDRVRARAS